MPRKKANVFYIYKTTCTITNKYYIGMHSTANINDGYLGSGKRLRHSIRKHGKENHVREILEYCDSREHLIEAEKKAITSEMLCDKQCMNMMSGGTGGYVSVEACTKGGKIAGFIIKSRIETDSLIKEQYSKMNTANLKLAHQRGNVKYNTRQGVILSEEIKHKMSESSKGMGKGETNSQYGTCWIKKNGESKKIKSEDITAWIELGWEKGRIKFR